MIFKTEDETTEDIYISASEFNLYKGEKTTDGVEIITDIDENTQIIAVKITDGTIENKKIKDGTITQEKLKSEVYTATYDSENKTLKLPFII
jgi:hypothetical protein